MLFTNSNSRRDFIRGALLQEARSEEPIFIATAFFTDHAVLREMANVSGVIRLVVRLGYPTAPKALEDALDDSRIHVRYFTARSFHPKLYIFGNRLAYLGSANLTDAAGLSN